MMLYCPIESLVVFVKSHQFYFVTLDVLEKALKEKKFDELIINMCSMYKNIAN